jgi:hypothetical protein
MSEELCRKCNDYPCRCLADEIDAEEIAAIDPRNYEPECTCRYIDVDLVDALDCEFHNKRSQWNQDCAQWNRAEVEADGERREIEAIWVPEPDWASTDEGAPF